ncbi:MAG: aldolase [Verrucomicrobiae bacterium]|nr:aldolase [Verrucomicrobiae bacterium]
MKTGVRRSKILAKLRAGKIARVACLGHFIPAAPFHAAGAGYDGIWVDGEHRAFETTQTLALIAFHHLADLDCIWRPPTLEKTGLYRLLEDGATGLMIPHVSTPEKARALVQAVKFPPLGDRGFDAAGLDCRYSLPPLRAYGEAANRETCLVVQIETPEALENADAIAAEPGVDVLFLGPGDMSARLDCSPSPTDPRMAKAQEQVNAAAARHGKSWGRPIGSADDLRRVVDAGARFVVMGSEFMGILNAYRQAAADFDRILGESLADGGSSKDFVP